MFVLACFDRSPCFDPHQMELYSELELLEFHSGMIGEGLASSTAHGELRHDVFRMEQ